jgi:hypothetical protein
MLRTEERIIDRIEKNITNLYMFLSTECVLEAVQFC